MRASVKEFIGRCCLHLSIFGILYENSPNMVIEDVVGLSLISEVWVVIAVIVDILPGHSTNYSGDIFSCTAKSRLTPAGKLINFCSI